MCAMCVMPNTLNYALSYLWSITRFSCTKMTTVILQVRIQAQHITDSVNIRPDVIKTEHHFHCVGDESTPNLTPMRLILRTVSAGWFKGVSHY